MHPITCIDFLSPVIRSEIKKILANVKNSDGQSEHAFEVCFDVHLRSYDRKCATLSDVMQFLNSIKHYDAKLQKVVNLYHNMHEMKVTVKDLRWAYKTMLDQGWCEDEISDLWNQIDFDVIT